MAERHRPDDLAQLRARLDAQEAEIVRLKHRRRFPRRLPPVLLAALLVALVPLATLAANPFNDLNFGSVHNANIDAIYNAGITTGCDPDVAYCPSGTVTREEMASFLARTAGLGTNPPVANAKTAQTAGDAALLGGQPPAAYARLDGDARFASLAVDSTIRSPRFKIVQLFASTPGPLPKSSTVFATGGGPLLVFASGSGFRAPANGAGTLGMSVLLDGQSVGVVRVFANEVSSHRALVGGALLVPNVAEGSHTLTLTPLVDTATDSSDYFSVTVLELPFDCAAGTTCS
ncbi:MAG TPA: hypothetical protein VIL85_05195 [Thermomicrobiales bacterium]